MVTIKLPGEDVTIVHVFTKMFKIPGSKSKKEAKMFLEIETKAPATATMSGKIGREIAESSARRVKNSPNKYFKKDIILYWNPTTNMFTTKKNGKSILVKRFNNPISGGFKLESSSLE